MKKGAELESFIQFVYSKLLANEDKENVSVYKNYFYTGVSGVKHEFDVYYEVKIAKNIHKIAIECKDKTSPVEKRDITEFYGKLSDCPGVQGVFVSESGYRDSAKQFANCYKIKTITPSELPSIYQIAEMDLRRVILPDDETEGKPFWCIMEKSDMYEEMTNGCYFVVSINGEQVLPLFISKKAAEEVRKKAKNGNQYSVYGIRRENLSFLCDIIPKEIKLGICPLLACMIKDGVDFWVIQVGSEKLKKEFME